MDTSEELRAQILAQLQGSLALDVAYVGVVNGLFSALAELEQADGDALAGAAGQDRGYVARWCDAAYAFDLVEEIRPGVFALTERGHAFRPDATGTLMPLAVQAMLSAHMAERAAALMPSGERPGEKVLAERETILPWFGPMLEASFGPLLEREILDGVPVFEEVDRRGGLALDLGCGNGWYLRRLARRFPGLRGVGIDAFRETIDQAVHMARTEGLADRLSFQTGDLHALVLDEPADLIAMNRALHHVWSQKKSVFRGLRQHLKVGGAAVIWEPSWPADRSALRDPARRGVAFQNLAEHIQGNHFLRPDEIVAEFEAVEMKADVYLFAEDREAVVVGRRDA